MSLNYVQGIVQKEETSGNDDLTDSSEEKISQSKVCFHHYFSQSFIGLHIRYHNDSKKYYVLLKERKELLVIEVIKVPNRLKRKCSKLR